jgi:hypothetical protein
MSDKSKKKSVIKNTKLPSAIANMTTIEEVNNYYQKIISCMPNNVYWRDSKYALGEIRIAKFN